MQAPDQTRILATLEERLNEIARAHQEALDALLARIKERRLKELRDSLTHTSS